MESSRCGSKSRSAHTDSTSGNCLDSRDAGIAEAAADKVIKEARDEIFMMGGTEVY